MDHSDISDDSETASSSFTPPRKKLAGLSGKKSVGVKVKKLKKAMQKYNKKWENKFTWVKNSKEGPTLFRCTICQVDRSCESDGITALKRHSNSEKHRSNVTNVKTSKNIFDMCKKLDDTKTRATIVELQVALFILKNNLPIATSDDIMELIKGVNIDKDVRSKLTCNRTKCTALINNVIGKHNFDELVQTLQHHKFSLIIDESTDIGTVKHLVLCIRYVSDGGARDSFLALLEVTDGKHDGLYKLIVDFFNTHGIPYKDNMVGFASDGASVMFGKSNSVAAKFQREIPHLFTMKCICHSLARAVSYAVQTLPPEVDNLMSGTYCYLKYSSNRRQALGALQKLLDVPEHKILKVMKVRWLSLNSAVSRYVEQYDVLFEYFEKESSGKNKEAKEIFDLLRSRWNKLYLQFLNFALPLVCDRNREFQSETPKIHLLHRRMETLFKNIVSFYMKEDYVDNTDPEFLEYTEITSENAGNWEPLRTIDLGPVTKAELFCLPPTIPVTDIDAFRKQCRQFYITLAKEIYKRFPFHDKSVKLLQQFGFMDPSNLGNIRDIAVVAHFFGFNLEETHEEFKKLKRMFKNTAETDMRKFWEKVRATVRGDDSLEFPLILEIVGLIEALPHSSANCERIFSQINLNKTKTRNSLSTETITGILHGKALIDGKEVTKMDCKPLLKYVNQNMY